MDRMTKAELLKELAKRDLMPTFKQWEKDNVIHNIFFHLGYVDSNGGYLRKHCYKTANKISPRFPIIRLAGLYHDTSCFLSRGKMRNKLARVEAKENAWQIMQYFQFSEAEKKKVQALIHVHDFNLISTNVLRGRDPKEDQPLRQWRKALMVARKIDPTITWREILRLVLADVDGKNAWWRKWLARPIIRYFKKWEAEGLIVYSKNDLAVTAYHIWDVCPELDKRYMGRVINYLMDYIAFHGYETNDKTELQIEAVGYIRGKQAKEDYSYLDSRIRYEP